jgi:hypothetical protein
MSFLSILISSSSSPVTRVDPLLLPPLSPATSSTTTSSGVQQQQQPINPRPITAAHHKTGIPHNNNNQWKNYGAGAPSVEQVQTILLFLIYLGME